MPHHHLTPKMQQMEDSIVNSMRAYFLRFIDYVAEKYKDRITYLVRWYVKTLPRHIASSEQHDLDSEARIAFIDSLKTWDPRKGELWTYASTRAKGAMQDYLRKRGTDPVAGMFEWITQAAYVYLAFNKQIIHHDRVDEAIHLEQSMKELSENERKVVTGYYEEDKTFKQIGTEIGLSESQVSRICKEATAKMKKLYTLHQ